MSMSAKDYRLLAAAIRAANACVDDTGWDDRIHVEHIADALAGNPRFDRDRFVAAVLS